MSNRSYVIVQTFIHFWRISPQTFVNSVSNKHHSWTNTLHRVQQTHASFPWLRRGLVWSASDKRAPCERSEPNIQSNKSANRCKDWRLRKLYACKICTIFEQLTAFFFRHTFAIQVVNHWHTSIANSLRSGTRHAACSRARVPRNHPPKKGKTEQLAALKCFHCVTKVSYS